MAAERDTSTATDFLVAAIGPALIVLMVGSLVFFLVEVLYAGAYSERLLYTLFFFVVGAVLIARISIQMDAARASMYGLALAIATFIALLSYVEYPGGGWLKSFGWLVNLGLMALIWWSAHKLTWDCTHIDDKKKGAGRGLLSAAGLDVDAKPEDVPSAPSAETPAKAAGKKKKKKGKHDTALWTWIENYQKHREVQRKGPHTPGVWVIYFALAALPLFALGQSLIGPEDENRRRATFLQMAVYIGSALALLVATSYLGLRRYLRQRKAKVPAALTASWLGFGTVLIVIFLTLGAFLPRPHSEVPWFGISRAGKSEREASRFAVHRDSAGKGEGARGEKTKAGDGDASGKNGQPGGGKSGEKGSGSGNQGKGGSGGKGKSSGDRDGKSEGKSGGRESKESESRDPKGDEKSNENAEKRDDENESDGKSQSETEKDSDKDKAEGRDRSRRSPDSSPKLGGVLNSVSNVLKWIVYAVVAVLVVVGIALAILKYLAPFTGWAQRLLDALRNWWAGLFGGRKRTETKKEASIAAPAGPVRPPPFHEFPNPFADGSADRREPAELTDYTFLALDAWAWDRDSGRELMETPLEFATRLGRDFSELKEILGQFVKLYARVTYSEYPLPKDTLAVLEQTWEGMVHGVAVA